MGKNAPQSNGNGKKTVVQMLNETTASNAFSMIESMGVLKMEYDKKLKHELLVLNMTNNSILRRLTNKQRERFMFILGHAIVASDVEHKIEKKMECKVREIWAESNKIGNDGMDKLAQLIES